LHAWLLCKKDGYHGDFFVAQLNALLFDTGCVQYKFNQM